MGYVHSKTYKLTFEDPELEGLEVRARSASVAQFMELSELKGSETREAVGKMFDVFAAALVSWNLEDGNGVTLPMTVDSLYAQDFGFAMSLVTAWMGAVADIPGPLGEAVNSGVISLAPSLPMEPLLPSRAS